MFSVTFVFISDSLAVCKDRVFMIIIDIGINGIKEVNKTIGFIKLMVTALLPARLGLFTFDNNALRVVSTKNTHLIQIARY